jgi:aminoglycoside phosphotransferase (APT) family kinase protein
MTHSDIRPDNILVLVTDQGKIKVTGLVDWELSGAYPEYWEFVKALAGVNCDTSDWFSYLPTESIGNHSGAWRQDCFVSRMVL